MTDTSSAPTARRVVVGASGGVGRHVIEQALGGGHEVTAVVRTPRKLAVSDPKLTVVTAELSNREAIDAAVRGGDAVIRAGFLGRDKLSAEITRADIASFLLDQLDDTRFLRAAPAVGN